jgi:hydrogenase nickel incorporation protein HypA/HybF
MHEMSIARSIVDTVLDEAHKAKAKRVIKVTLTIGELAGIMPDSLSFCFELLTRTTIAADAELAIETVPVIAQCRPCGSTFTIRQHRYRCHACDSPDIVLQSGRELQIAGMEITSETD